MGLLVNRSKPEFERNSDINIMCRFFEDSTKSSRITGVDKLISSCTIILLIIYHGHYIFDCFKNVVMIRL